MRITKSPERSATKQFYSFHTTYTVNHEYHDTASFL